jgi:hypothetical protein
MAMNKFLSETEVMTRLSNLRSDHSDHGVGIAGGDSAEGVFPSLSVMPSVLPSVMPAVMPSAPAYAGAPVAPAWRPQFPVEDFPDGEPHSLFWRGLGRASGGLTLVLPGVAAAGALVLQSGLLGTAAALAYVVGVGARLCRKGLWEGLLAEQRRAPPRLPHEADLLDETARRLLARLVSARLGRHEMQMRANRRQLQRLDQLSESVVDLERLASDAVVALDRMGRFISGHDRRQISTDRDRLERVAEISAPALRAELRAAAAVASESLRRHDDILGAQALLEAQLDTLVRTLELIPAWLVQLETHETTATLDLRRGLRPALEAEMRVAEESLAAALAQETGSHR